MWEQCIAGEGQTEAGQGCRGGGGWGGVRKRGAVRGRQQCRREAGWDQHVLPAARYAQVGAQQHTDSWVTISITKGPNGCHM